MDQGKGGVKRKVKPNNVDQMKQKIETITSELMCNHQMYKNRDNPGFINVEHSDGFTVKPEELQSMLRFPLHILLSVASQTEPDGIHVSYSKLKRKVMRGYSCEARMDRSKIKACPPDIEDALVYSHLRMYSTIFFREEYTTEYNCVVVKPTTEIRNAETQTDPLISLNNLHDIINDKRAFDFQRFHLQAHTRDHLRASLARPPEDTLQFEFWKSPPPTCNFPISLRKPSKKLQKSCIKKMFIEEKKIRDENVIRPNYKKIYNYVKKDTSYLQKSIDLMEDRVNDFQILSDEISEIISGFPEKLRTE